MIIFLNRFFKIFYSNIQISVHPLSLQIHSAQIIEGTYNAILRRDLKTWKCLRIFTDLLIQNSQIVNRFFASHFYGFFPVFFRLLNVPPLLVFFFTLYQKFFTLFHIFYYIIAFLIHWIEKFFLNFCAYF